MTRKRIAGILFVVLAMALGSVALAQSKKQVDINSATEEELVAAGIEKAAVKKIIEARLHRPKVFGASERILRQIDTAAFGDHQLVQAIDKG